jgi:hypothetical protein
MFGKNLVEKRQSLREHYHEEASKASIASEQYRNQRKARITDPKTEHSILAETALRAAKHSLK